MYQTSSAPMGHVAPKIYQPVSVTMGLAAASMLHRTLAQFPPPATAILMGTARSGARPVGSYLLELGYITPEQLAAALVEQRQSRMLSAMRLGEVLVKQGLLSEKVLATVLMLQSLEHSLDKSMPAPRFIGEYMLLTRQISPEQLALALEAQTILGKRGRRVLFGNVLVRLNIVTSEQLQSTLETYNYACADRRQVTSSDIDL